MMARVLVVEDDAEMAAVLRERLARRGYGVAVETSSEDALERIAGEDFDAVLTDVRMRGIDGIVLCERIGASRPGLPVLVITAFGDLETAVLAIRAGAYDFLTKPVEIEELAFRLDRAHEHRRLAQEVVRLRELAPAPASELDGESSEMVRLRELVARVAASDAPVLVLGETGAGKERVARAIHRLGARSAGPFVAVSCAAMPEHLIESELFGHERGAFTDAHSARAGMLAQANGGTLLLDEIGELPISLQPKLLRVLQERTVRPLGASREQPFDARVIVATHRDLDAAVEEGRFREDLFFRLDVLRVQVPPLRARSGDVLGLAQGFVRRCAARSGKAVTGLSRAAAEKLLRYTWPGNVRELENCIERAVALTSHDQILPEDLPERIRDYGRRDVLVAGDDLTELVPLQEVEQRYVARVMEAVGGNKTLAAKILGVDRKTLYRKLGQGE
ncbi:MAG: sigma-54-dependent Fis family transcriptional regulator [Deltaproteobacteria bacterium]|nr:MAG: sigma-54-dependent Fis family transcriptional regulator [Deltaproteobacteria bacterium]